MSAFLDPLAIRTHGWTDGRPTWITLAPLRYRSARLDATVAVPAEFVTDLASVPRLPLTWLVAGGRAPRPAVLHDYCYQKGEIPAVGGHPIAVNRAEADALFAEAMAADETGGTNRLTRFLMWTAVRVGGWSAWRGQQERARELNPVWTEQGWPTEAG